MKKIILFGLIALILMASSLLYKALEQRLLIQENNTQEIQKPQRQALPPAQAPVQPAAQLSSQASATPTQTLSEEVAQPETSLPVSLNILVQMQQQVSSQKQDQAAGYTAEQAKAVARQKYIEGLEAFNNDDLQRAKRIWTEAHELNPSDTDVEVALRRVTEMLDVNQTK